MSQNDSAVAVPPGNAGGAAQAMSDEEASLLLQTAVDLDEEELISRLNKALVAFVNECDRRRARKTSTVCLLTARQVAEAAHKELALARRDNYREQDAPCSMCGQKFNRMFRPGVGARPLG